jgi:hypothetical protein
MKHAVALAALALAGSGCVIVTNEERTSNPEHAQQAFDMLKSLAGQWHGTATSGNQQFPVDVTYEVVSAGSAVMERLFKGTEHEMVTLYHRDGERLLLTHYCSQGNQPRMELVGWTALPEATASFTFCDSTNWADASQLIMHDARLTSISEDHLTASWTAWVNGKADHTANFSFERVKSVRSLGY